MAAAFKDGSVRRIKLVNFMTYRSIEFHPGPKLNLVVGPNGTGKSSLVSALCLGLAGKPTLLGKAEKIGQFVKQGEDVASVEIELVRGEEAVVVRRDLTAAGSSSWSVGGAAASQRHVEDLVASLGIQLHSLGQFLPQEKVGDFAKLSRAERLALMQRSLPSGELLSLHETLTQLQQQRHSLQSTLSSKTSHLEKLQQRQEAQASAIYKFRQWERHNQHITWLTRKRAWVEYEVEVTLYHEVKSRASQALAEKRRLVQAAEPLARTQRDAQQRWHDATHARSHTEKEMAEKVKEIQSLEEILERHSDKVEEEKQTVSRRLADDKDRVTRIQTAVRIIDGWQEELRSLDADQRGSGEGGSGEGVGEGGAGVGEAALKAVCEELAGLGVRTAGMSAERHRVTSRLASLQQDLQRAEARLSRIQDSASRVLERLRSQFPDAVSASLWLAENRDRFSGDIQGPLAITLSPRDEQAACLLENHVSKNDLKTFIFQIDADMETFLTLMRDGKNLRVNAVRAPDKSADEYVPVVPLATITQPELLRCMKWYLDRSLDSIRHEHIQDALRAMEYLFKFVVQSRSLYARATGGLEEEEFRSAIRDLFHSIKLILCQDGRDNEGLVYTQVTLLTSLPAIYEELLRMFKSREVADLVRDALGSLPTVQHAAPGLDTVRLQCVGRTVESKLFLNPESRRFLLPVILHHIRMHLEHQKEPLVCSGILSNIFSIMKKSSADPRVCEEVDMIVESLLEVLMKTVAVVMSKGLRHELMGEYVSCLLSLLRQMSDRHYQQLLENFSSKESLKEFVLQIFSVFSILMKQEVFPRDWMVMRMVISSVIVTTMKQLSPALHQNFGNESFDIQVVAERCEHPKASSLLQRSP